MSRKQRPNQHEKWHGLLRRGSDEKHGQDGRAIRNLLNAILPSEPSEQMARCHGIIRGIPARNQTQDYRRQTKDKLTAKATKKLDTD